MTRHRSLDTAGLAGPTRCLAALPVVAGDHDMLVANRTPDRGHRIDKVANLGANRIKRDLPLTDLMIDRCMTTASVRNAARFPDPRAAIDDTRAVT